MAIACTGSDPPCRPIRLNPRRGKGSAIHMLQRRTVLAGAAGAVALPAWAQFRVEISGVGATQLPIAVLEVVIRDLEADA